MEQDDLLFGVLHLHPRIIGGDARPCDALCHSPGASYVGGRVLAFSRVGWIIDS